MKASKIFMVFLLAMISFTSFAQIEKHRLIVLADMGNEPDEEQQMMQLLMYSNEIDIVGLISVTGIHLRPGNKSPYRSVTHPELFHRLIDGYEKVYANLHLHDDRWMNPFNIRTGVCAGQPEYGMTGVGEGKTTEGSKWIIHQATLDDERPLYIVVNAGSNTLAQALYDYRNSHTPAEVDSLVATLRVYENGAQGECGAWINHEFPNIHWVRSLHQTKDFGGPSLINYGPYTWQPYPYTTKGQDDWAREHIRTNHGALGELYPIRVFHTHKITRPDFLGGGGVIPWMSLTLKGLTNPSEQSWGGWSGRFSIEKVKNAPARTKHVQETEMRFQPWAMYVDAVDYWVDPETGKEHNDEHCAIWPWRKAMWNDLQARMDWCVKPFDEANHHPVAAINNDSTNQIIFKTVKGGETVEYDASMSSDPDNDELRFYWWHYDEAGSKPYGKEISIKNSTNDKIKFNVPKDASGKELHLILEVWDKSNIVPLVDYRRVIMNVK